VSRELPGLDVGEEVLASAQASFRGATAASSRGTFVFGGGRARVRSYTAWAEVASAVGFPTAGPDMVLALTNRRLAVWRTSFVLGRPVELAGDLALDRIAGVAAVRHGIVTGLALVLGDGTILEVEALLGRRLRTLARRLQEAIDAHRRGS
jgi:hypothetical protein